MLGQVTARTILLISWLVFSATMVHAADCSKLLSPGSFENPNKPWGRSDTGVLINGFADVKAPTGVYQVQHGVDLSLHNEVDYRHLGDCGAEFGFVRMDKDFSKHVSGLRDANIKVLPYFFFNIKPYLTKPALYTDVSEAASRKFLDTFAAIGKQAASDFNHDVDEQVLRHEGLASFNGPMLALDVEQKLDNGHHSDQGVTEIQQVYFGKFYARAVCTFVSGVQAKYPNLIIMLYTTPSVYAEYIGKKPFPQDEKCIQQLPVWLAWTTRDGGDMTKQRGKNSPLEAAKTCNAPGLHGNRCIVHQYTHRGLFAAFQPSNPKPHIDLDRFFDFTFLANESGGMYVRTNAAH